jgi:hypothetical protein
MIGYKIFRAGYRGFGDYQFNLEGDNISATGFSFCEYAPQCCEWYPVSPENTYAIVEALDDVKRDGNRLVTNKLRIVKTLTLEEFRKLLTVDIKTENLVCSYVDGKLHGEYTEKVDDVVKSANYRHGILDGIYREWYDWGVLKLEYLYVDGKLVESVNNHLVVGRLSGYNTVACKY